MKKILLTFIFCFFLLSLCPFARAINLNKLYCDRVHGKKGNTIFCQSIYSSVFDWYQTNRIESRFGMAAGLNFKDGVWTYLNWPLEIIFTDAIFKGLAQGNEYPPVVQLQDLTRMDSNRDLIPNKVQTINDLVVQALEREVFKFGFRHPARERSKYIIVKLEDGGWVESSLIQGAIGRAWVNSEGFPLMSLDPYLSDEMIEKTITHELFHLIQFSYNPDMDSHISELNFSEGTALWMERQLFEFDKYLYEKDYVDFFKAYYSAPNRSLYGTNPLDKDFQYGTVLWPIYLEKTFGQSIIKSIWETYFSQVSSSGSYNNALYFATDTALKSQKKNKSSLIEAYRGFVRWIFDKNQYRRDAERFPDVAFLDEIKSYPTDWLHPAEDIINPSLLGSSFIKFVTANSKEDFVLQFRGVRDATWALDFYIVDGKKNTYLKKFSALVPISDDVKTKTIRIPKAYLKGALVMIVSPVDAVQLKDSTLDAFNLIFPFEFKAEFKKPSSGNKSSSSEPRQVKNRFH